MSDGRLRDWSAEERASIADMDWLDEIEQYYHDLEPPHDVEAVHKLIAAVRLAEKALTAFEGHARVCSINCTGGCDCGRDAVLARLRSGEVEG